MLFAEANNTKRKVNILKWDFKFNFFIKNQFTNFDALIYQLSQKNKAVFETALHLKIR